MKVLRRILLGLLIVVGAGSIALNVYFVRAERAAVPPPPAVLAKGTQLKDFSGRDELGNLVNVKLASTDRPTLLYVVTPSCIWCKRNRDNFLKVVSERSGDFNVVLVSLNDSGFKTYVEKLRPLWGDAEVATVTGLSDELKDRMMLHVTPTTLIVDAGGRVTDVWTGAYTQKTLLWAENFFLVKMPGLVPDQQLQ